jgi:hypothetical protein
MERERERRGQGKRVAGAGWGEMDGGGVVMRGGTRQMGKDCSDIVGVHRVSAGSFGTVRWNHISSNV